MFIVLYRDGRSKWRVVEQPFKTRKQAQDYVFDRPVRGRRYVVTYCDMPE